MSDDSDEERSVPVLKKERIHYGSLADAETVRRLTSASQDDVSGPSAGPGDAAAHAKQEYMELEKPGLMSQTKEAMLAEFERRRKARQLVVPTEEGELRRIFRALEEPVSVFGEDMGMRRERLRMILSLMTEEERQALLLNRDESAQKPDQQETWYHEGPESLREARILILKFSLPKAKERLNRAKEAQNAPPHLKHVRLQETHKWIRSLAVRCSQVADSRPVSFVQFSPNSELVATASWSGLCKLWKVPNLEQLRVFRGHNGSAGCIKFHPGSTKTIEPSVLNLASGAHDGSVKLWSLDSDEPLASIEGHEPYRVSSVAFHPSGRFLATTCFDHSWRLFDLDASEELLFQEGHAREVMDIAFQCDGSVCVTGSLDSYGRVWDLRTGRCIMVLDGHLKGICTVDFAPNGYHMASGSIDNSCRLWDLRMRRCIYTLPAHQSTVSRVKFDEIHADYMVTSGYDHTVKLWTNPGWHPLRSLHGHENKVMSVDVSPNGKWLASSSWDRTFKLWAPEL